MCPPRKIFAKRATKKINQFDSSRHLGRWLGLERSESTEGSSSCSTQATRRPRLRESTATCAALWVRRSHLWSYSVPT
ncbi:transposase [Tsukamurella tyrosinosolvens]|uniref:transposase n=1 Tax=Tsukamurella tyrosinosolvens TaxID=57704 RepID=UPI003B75CAF9